MILRALALGLTLATAAGSADPPPPGGSHRDLACGDCHGSGGIADCVPCHAASANIHPVGVVPAIPVPGEFALGADGTLLCRTCHRLHGGVPETRYLVGEGGDRAAFCVRCHGDALARTNPHLARAGTTRCAYCHASLPESPDSLGAVKARGDIVRLCDFCHGAVAKDHPRNIDQALSLPKGLPLTPDGGWTCVTCHDPHGTTATTHYVRLVFAKHFERGRQGNPHVDSYFACKACHTSSVASEIRAPDYRLRYKGDIGVLCVSCHLTERGHHPTGVRLPPPMAESVAAAGSDLPLDREGRITCYTCHDNGCTGGKPGMQVRYYDRTKLQSDLCWVCHRRDEFARQSPHVDDDARCGQCHESRPVRGVSRGLVTVATMVCLRCHAVKLHPSGADHLRVPSPKIRVDESLPLGPGGAVTCATCHDPHGTPNPSSRRLRAGKAAICEQCHWRK